VDESNALQIRYASLSFNQWLGPIKEAPSNKGAFLFQRHPNREGNGGEYFKGMGMLIGLVGGPDRGPLVSSLGTWNSAWNFGL